MYDSIEEVKVAMDEGELEQEDMSAVIDERIRIWHKRGLVYEGDTVLTLQEACELLGFI